MLNAQRYKRSPLKIKEQNQTEPAKVFTRTVMEQILRCDSDALQTNVCIWLRKTIGQVGTPILAKHMACTGASWSSQQKPRAIIKCHII